MKKLVGKREIVDVSMKEAVALVGLFSLRGPKPTTIIYNDTHCNKCASPVKITLTEEVQTGEIWFEGPDICEGCGNQLSDEKANTPPLSQEAIHSLFGEH